MSETARCQICGEPMPPGEEMFTYHGYSGPCPKPPLPKGPSKPWNEVWAGEDHSSPPSADATAGELVALRERFRDLMAGILNADSPAEEAARWAVFDAAVTDLAAPCAECARLREALSKSTTRLEILLGRMRACDAGDVSQTGHRLSLEEGASWIEEQRGLCGER